MHRLEGTCVVSVIITLGYFEPRKTFCAREFVYCSMPFTLLLSSHWGQAGA